MTRSPAVSAVVGYSDEPVDEREEEEGEEEARGEEDMSNLGGGSDPDSDPGGDGSGEEEEVEEELIEVEEDEEDAEEEEEADGGDEETEEGEEAEEAAKEIISEKENEEGEEEEEQGESGSDADSPPDSPAPMDEDVNDDASQEIKSEGQDEDLKLFHSSTNISEANSMHSSLITEALLEKHTCTEILNVKSEHEILGDRQPPFAKDSVDIVKPESLLLKEEELVEVSQKRCRNGDLDGILHLEKDDPNLDRPGSQMAGFLENCNKRPAVACAFFARGWCIKGNSCRFLHQKHEDDASQEAKENLTRTSSQINLKEDTGLKHEVDRFYTPHEPLISTAENSPSKSLQRALVRAYGGLELPEFQDKDLQSLFQTDSSLCTKAHNVDVQPAAADSGFFSDRHRITYVEGASIPGSGWPSFQLSEFPRASIVQAEDVNSCDASFSREKLDSHFNCIDGGPSMTEGFISRKYLGEGKVHQELSKKGYANDGSFSRGSPVTKSTFIPEYKYCSSTSLMPSSISLSTSAPNGNERSTTDSVALHDPNTSYRPKGLFNSSFQDPLSHALHLNNSLNQNAVHSTFGSIPLGSEDVGTYKRLESLDYERGYHGLGSSSPLPQFGPEKNLRQEISGSTLVSAERKVKSLGDAWEPSKPFRSSFYCPATSISSPGNQCEPLYDSIEPSQSLSHQHKSIDDVPKGSHSPGYNDLKLKISFCRSHERIVSKSISEHRAGAYSSSNAGVSGSGTLDGVNRSSMLKEKSWSPGHVIDVGNMKENDYEDGPRAQEDKGRHQKETKALKNFRACLVEFVKDLVKPAWREGHLSKDAHKMVVKKAAEKVLSALQPHQIPSTMDAINQYLSASRPKIVKLVEGYVDKYAKS